MTRTKFFLNVKKHKKKHKKIKQKGCEHQNEAVKLQFKFHVCWS